jgi:hypothetical protein
MSGGAPSHPESLPLSFEAGADEVLRRTDELYARERPNARALTADASDILRHYDVAQMDHAVAICHWGRSGSIFLASYLDGHPDVIVLPNLAGEPIYKFYDEYRQLSIWEKVVAYPVYCGIRRGGAADLFLSPNPAGDYAIDPARYYAATLVLLARYGGESRAWLENRSTFIKFVHVAYAIARGQVPNNPRPVIAYAQHWVNERLASAFIEDFPAGKFLHTIRDPISTFDSWFQIRFVWAFNENSDPSATYSFPAFDAVHDLLTWDRPHRGMGPRTRAVRFEDMHLEPEALMRRVAAWLEIPFHPCLLESTLNGNPLVVQGGGASWVGAKAENAQRRSKNLSRHDQALIFALLQRNFIAWHYAISPAYARRIVRLCTILLCWFAPMRMEMRNARLLMRQQALPAFKKHRWLRALAAMPLLLLYRARMMLLIARQALVRLHAKPTLLDLL